MENGQLRMQFKSNSSLSNVCNSIVGRVFSGSAKKGSKTAPFVSDTPSETTAAEGSPKSPESSESPRRGFQREESVPALPLLDDESPQVVPASGARPAFLVCELRPMLASWSPAIPSSPAVWSPASPASPASARRISVAEDVMECVPAVETWTVNHADFARTLQQAARNHGRVDLMKYKFAEVRPRSVGKLAVGDFVAVKRMPNKWMTASPKQFMSRYPKSSEQPWLDIGVLCLLNRESFDYVITLHGVFQDFENTFVMSSLASNGDLFSWSEKLPRPGSQREAVIKPIVSQMTDAVRWLHNIGIAHRDLSLENVLLNDESGQFRVQLIDFGMATFNRMCRGEVRGKQSYQAPEMHLNAPYDCFLSDAFALGVTVFALACQDYPWISTKPASCQLWEYASKHGVRKMLRVRQLRKGRRGEHLQSVLSANLVNLLVEVLRFDPSQRSTLGEDCYGDGQRPSILGHDWVLPASRSTSRASAATGASGPRTSSS